MREIKFRGKRVDTKEWAYGYYFMGFTGIPYILVLHDHILRMTEFYEVIPETVGQFTGLLDENGKKIFEGDVVFAGYGEYYQGTHEYSTTITVDMSNYDALNALCNANVVEVIGNIQDNPLLS